MFTILRDAAQRDKIDFLFVETIVSNYASFQMNMRVQPNFHVVGFFNEKYDPTALSKCSKADTRTVLVVTVTMYPLGQASEQETLAAEKPLRDYYRDDVFTDYPDCEPGEAAPAGATSGRPLLQLYRDISGEEVEEQVALDPTFFMNARGEKVNQLKAWLLKTKACSAIPHHELVSDELREFVDKSGVTAHLFLQQQSGGCTPSEEQRRQMVALLLRGQVQSGAPGTEDEFHTKLKKAYAIVAFTSADGRVLAVSTLKPVQYLGAYKFTEKGSTCGLGLPGSGKHMFTILRDAAQRDKIDFLFVETIVSNYASFQMNMRVQPNFHVVGFFNEKYDPTALSKSSKADTRTVLVVTVTMYPLGQASEQETLAAEESLRDYYRDDVFTDYPDCEPGDAAPAGATSGRPLLQLYRDISGEEVEEQVALDPTFLSNARGEKVNQRKAWLVQSDTKSTKGALCAYRHATPSRGAPLTKRPSGDGIESPPTKRLRMTPCLTM